MDTAHDPELEQSVEAGRPVIERGWQGSGFSPQGCLAPLMTGLPRESGEHNHTERILALEG